MATHVLKASVVLSALVPHKASSCTILQNSVELGALSGGKGLSSKRVQRICLRKRSGPSEMSPRAAINVAEVAAEVGKSEITWQVAAGAVAGVTPFVVAGVEFSKRIVAQRKCQVCGGSGLELVGRYYRRCTGCGGFLPWQSWKRFFTS